MPDALEFLRALESQTRGIGDPAVDVCAIVACAEALNFSQQEKEVLHSLLCRSEDIQAARPSIYFDSIKRMLDQAPPADKPPACLATHDALLTDDYNWPVDKLLNFAIARATISDRAVAVVASVKNEGLSLLEWVAYHMSIGIEKIFLYWNDNDDGSTSLISALDKAGYITAIENATTGKVPPQGKAYEHALHLLPELRRYRWAFFLDADEFLISHAGPEFDVHALLSHVEERSLQQPIDAVMFNWKWFGSENAFARTPGLLLERFLYSKPDPHVKTLIRLSNITSMRHLHCPIMINPERIVRSDFSPHSHSEPGSGRTIPVYQLGQINHYWNKSFEEFLIKKFRGRGEILLGNAQLEFNSFFEWGGNGSRGVFDPPPELVVSKTRSLVRAMQEHPEIRTALAEVELQFLIKMRQIQAQNDVAALYENRGKFEDAA